MMVSNTVADESALAEVVSELDHPVALIVAMAENQVIGHGNAMPWYLPEELKHFKRMTMGKPLIMGRKTFESIGRPLPGRLNIVVTRDQHFAPAGVKVVYDLAQALKVADGQALIDGAEEIMVIGGAQIYRQMLPHAQRLYQTLVHAQPVGDAWFPELDPAQWRYTSQDVYPGGEGNRYPYDVCVLQRQSG